MTDFWKNLGTGSRAGLLGGVVAILLFMALATWWVLRPDYQVLFADLKPQDAQAMTAELDRQKIPYRVGEDGASLLVDRSIVHATRLKLMGRDLPLHGAVGFELFNNADFGMTEFAQKINYQRALQGEITRTIQSMDEVRDVRVLLALPEQGLFKQPTARAKASVSLTLRPDQKLRPEQITGIQRLVAAAVPGMTRQDVTIVDRQGVALTRLPGDTEGDLQTGQLDLKRDMEVYLSRKVSEVLDRALGVGEALASVDVTLNMDQVKTTTEDVVASPPRPGATPVGVVIKERETIRDGGSPLDAKGGEAGFGNRAGSTQREVDYAVGRRVEQVVSQPGSVRQIQVIAAVRTPMDTAQQEQLKKLVAAAVGAVPDRGDVVVVHSLGFQRTSTALETESTAPADKQSLRSPDDHPKLALTPWATVAVWTAGVLLLVGLLTAVIIGRGSARRSAVPNTLSSAQSREAALAQVRAWLDQERVEKRASASREAI